MTNIQIRISKEEKAQVKAILVSLGLNFSSAIKMFLRQVIDENGIPFEVKNKLIEKKGKKENTKFNPFEKRKIV